MIVPPALISQRPFIKAHGDALAKALDLNMLGYPIINHRDGKFLLCDGQHRIYGLRENGFGNENLDCEVYEDLSDEEMAQLFLGRDKRKAISPFVKFHISCTAGYVRENAIRRIVEAHGLKISRSRSDNCVGAVSALIQIYETSPSKETAVGWCVRVAKNAFNGDAMAFDGAILEALGHFANRYNGKPIEKTLTDHLAANNGGIHNIMRRANALQEKTGNHKVSCVAAVLVDIYNKGLVGRARLASWWKETAVA